MKISSILFIFIAIIVGLALSQNTIPTYKQNSINWKQFQPLYTNKDDYVLIVDTRSKNVLKRSTNGGIDWSSNVLDKQGNIIYGNAGYYQRDDNIMVVNFPSYGKTQISVSNDAGQTFSTSAVFPHKVVSVSPHLDIEGLVIARSDNFILISEDFGLTWNNASSNGDVLFTPGGSSFPTDPLWDPSEKSAVFFAILASKTGSGAFSVSKDMGKTFKTLINGAVDMIYTDYYYYVGVIDALKGGNKLYVKSLMSVVTSTMDGFLLCQFPFGEDVQPNDFRILDDTSGAIFMGISNSKDGETSNKRFGTVYVSNGAGNIFTLSVNHVSISSNGYYDFMPLFGARGSYLYNKVSNFRDTTTAPVTMLSFISYDNGGRWNRLTPPTNMPCTVSGPCKLNVHGLSAFVDKTRGYGPIYSIASAPGLILATGNANPALSSDPIKSRVKTVLSTDNGQTWSKFFDEGTIYEFGNYGSSIIFATAMNDTKTFYYTFGLDQKPIAINMTLKSNVDVINIITSPRNDGNKFIFLVEDEYDIGQMIGVDLTNVLPSPCDDSSMQSYTTRCILGEKTTYRTVKPNTNCYMTQQAQISNKYCECTVEDFECDIGYESADDSSSDNDGSTSGIPSGSSEQLNCRKSIASQYVPITEENCTPGQTYIKSKGFRRVAATQCVGGVNATYSPEIVMCPSKNSSSGGKGWIAGVVIAILALAGLGGFGFYVFKNPDFKQKLLKMVGFSKVGPKYSVIGIKPNSLADDEFGIEDDDAQILNDNDLQDNEDF
ncbi:PDZ domain-containing protein [Dictyostelium discoideum AX4]|uniref:PDZ domain-containing protein n=1 Tax=Dictyostelium discoideum TaxID=44689 RepID=Q54GL5_DICDI|nr:PDZ domain-containing protein [Dictyostelium discoideum AX4]EAL62401.1 PDZ domain-containing protein [Dictyostelium discoideum AX4]|eukprot:XP_635902.1 PDZ domain-containing protein [Dictyostelium discoideum AX4]